LPGHRWVAELDGQVVGWTALSPTSTRECYAGVAESSIYVAESHRGRGIGKALIRQQVIAADQAGLWTLQTAIFTENRASIALHHAAGYRTVGIRERIAKLNDAWHDTVLIERRTDSVTSPAC
jgi:L-amino acid N-acyltransferase YncA